MAKGWATRVHIDAPLAAGGDIALSTGQAHHLCTVLRLGDGAPVAVFNAEYGEWLSRFAGRTLIVERQLRARGPEPDLWLLFAPVKRARLDWLVEKATELGVSALLPVWTRHTQAERVNLDRLRAHAVAAAEQSERLSVPELRPPQPLTAIVAGWPAERRLYVCDETGAGVPIAAAVRPGSAALLVGPEGGFAETELDALAKLPFASRVGLGPRVLRADTAAVAALTVYQAIAGDWRPAEGRRRISATGFC
jgi:16S rRNA (uracil1498-N3)-methyltransferase